MKRCSEVICKWYMFMHLHGCSWICHIFAGGQVVKKRELKTVQFLYIIYQIEYYSFLLGQTEIPSGNLT
jgi:adenine-specific DNA methylase